MIRFWCSVYVCFVGTGAGGGAGRAGERGRGERGERGYARGRQAHATLD